MFIIEWTKKEILFSFSQYSPINKRLAPNLRRLDINWTEETMNMKSMEMLFECDVLSSLTNFTLFGTITGFDVLHNVLSKLSRQYFYRFGVRWNVGNDVSLLDANQIFLNTFKQLEGSIPIELESFFEGKNYFMNARTLPKMNSYLCVHSYLDSMQHG